MVNPEFRRNLWLEMTQHRVIGMPLVLGALFLLVYLLNGRSFGKEVAYIALVMGGLMAVMWGASQAAESMLSEVRSHTWENQRMTAMSAWEMAWGKLFGGTVYSWYGTLICVAVYFLSTEAALPDALRYVALLLLSGLFVQGMALLSTLQFLKKERSVGRSQGVLYAIIGLFVVSPYLQMSIEKGLSITWYGLSLSGITFALASLSAFVCWGVVGIYQSMRSELQMQNGIWLWVLFVAWLMAYLSGFPDHAMSGRWSETSSRLLVSSLVVMSLAYVMILVESKDPVLFSRLKRLLQQGDWKRLNRTMPCWMATLLMGLVVNSVLAGLFFIERNQQYGLFFIAIFLFVLRDICIVLWVNFSRQRKRADMTAILYLLVLYGLLPAITNALGFDGLRLLFYPQWGEDVYVGTLLALLQFAGVLWLVMRRWQANYGVAKAIHE